MAQEFNQYPICVDCETVHLPGSQQCRRCGSAHLVPMEDAPVKIGLRGVFAAVLLIGGVVTLPWGVGLVLFPIGLFLAWSAWRQHKQHVDGLRRAAAELVAEQSKETAGTSDEFTSQGRVALEGGDPARAVKAFQQAITIGAGHRAKLGLALSYLEQGNEALALPILEEVNKLPDAPTDAAVLLAQLYVRADLTLPGRVDHLLTVRNLAGRALKREITLALARHASAGGAVPPGQAAAVLLEATLLAPHDAAIAAACARLRLAAGAPEEVPKLLSEFPLSTLTPAAIATYSAALHQMDDQGDQALSVYRKHLANHPQDGSVRIYLCKALIQAGQHAEAVQYCQEGVALSPANLQLRHMLALAHLMNGQYQAAGDQLKDLAWERVPVAAGPNAPGSGEK